MIQNPTLQFDFKEYSITLKQATNLLVKCNHDWRDFVAEILTVQDGKVHLRNLITKVFNPVIDGIPHPPTPPEPVPQLNLSESESDAVVQLLNENSSQTIPVAEKKEVRSQMVKRNTEIALGGAAIETSYSKPPSSHFTEAEFKKDLTFG